MGYIARLFWVFVPCAIFFAACTKEIKIDASSDASLRKSLINMSRDMSENEIKDFNNAIYGIIALVTNDIPKSEQLMQYIETLIDSWMLSGIAALSSMRPAGSMV